MSKGNKKNRELTVHYQNVSDRGPYYYGKYSQTRQRPFIALSGAWLEELGFIVNDINNFT